VATRALGSSRKIVATPRAMRFRIMPQIYDNIEHHLLTALRQTLQRSQRADFCARYFGVETDVATNTEK
jgi:hypothetical protein